MNNLKLDSLSINEKLHHAEPHYIGEILAIQQLNDLDMMIDQKRKSFMGYPCNASFRLEKFFEWWSKSSLSKSPLNDVGNPYSTSGYALNARSFETSVLKYFADLYSLESYWGYITSGGTQGNEQGLYMGRSVLENYGKPILYFSEEAHYSIRSLAKVLGLEVRIIKAAPQGEMDYEDLKSQIEPERPALFSLSIGTTFKGAIDRIEIVEQIVREKGIKHVFYHADSALFGGYLPFYESEGKPDLNFSKYPYDSIAVSGHKFFGSPTPLGVFLIRNEHVQRNKVDYIEYIHSHNITIPCSRSALNTLILWWVISTTPRVEFIKETDEMMKNALYLYQELKKIGYPAWLNPHSNTVFFRAPPQKISDKWTLSLHTCPHLGHLAHAIMMQHVDKRMIDELLQDLKETI